MVVVLEDVDDSLHQEVVVYLCLPRCPLHMPFRPAHIDLRLLLLFLLSIIDFIFIRDWPKPIHRLISHTQDPPDLVLTASHLKKEPPILLVIRQGLVFVLLTFLRLEVAILFFGFVCESVKSRNSVGTQKAFGLYIRQCLDSWFVLDFDRFG